MLTAELTGADLALWVARAIGYKAATILDDGIVAYVPKENGPIYEPFAPHEDWAQGGPLIEQHGGSLFRCNEDAPFWVATCGDRTSDRGWPIPQEGPTALIAAMRALVASVYGDSVPEQAP